MRFNSRELAFLVHNSPDDVFDKQGILQIKERQEGLFRKGEGNNYYPFSCQMHCMPCIMSIKVLLHYEISPWEIKCDHFWDQCNSGEKIFCIWGVGVKMAWNQPLKPSSTWNPVQHRSVHGAINMINQSNVPCAYHYICMNSMQPGVHIVDRKNLNWCSPFVDVSLVYVTRQKIKHRAYL